MDLQVMAMIQSVNAQRGLPFSALPNAPVVPDVERRRHVVRAARSATAQILERAARAVAPSTPMSCTPAH